MRVVEDCLPEILSALSPARRPLLTNALLNLAVNRILAVQGATATAGILQRLAELIRNGDRPSNGDGFRLNGHDA